MTIAWPSPGTYVLAVSGGCDSMALLHLLAQAAPRRGYQLVVAHFDHGLRPDSAADADLVAAAAAHWQLPFRLGRATTPLPSEAAARAARYQFLETAHTADQAAAIITAHHRDDLIETSLLNLARGTGRRGLAPLSGTPARLRPLLAVSRQQLRDYAARHQLQWHDDPTNQDLTNPRNLLRQRLLAQAPAEWQDHYLRLLQEIRALNNAIDPQLNAILEESRSEDNRYSFHRHLVRELSLLELAELLTEAARRLSPGLELNQRLCQELALFCKTGSPGKQRPIRGGMVILVHREVVMLCKSKKTTPQTVQDDVY